MDRDFPYASILDMEHYQSPTRPRMSMRDRAAQFSPFAAVTGLDEELTESGRLTMPRIELDEDERARLDAQLQELMTIPGREISVTYYIADALKDGGSYATVSGTVKRIAPEERNLIMADGTRIPLDDIFSIA